MRVVYLDLEDESVYAVYVRKYKALYRNIGFKGKAYIIYIV